MTHLELSLVLRLFAAMGIGGLVGIEREHSGSGEHFAGGRTLPLVALFGALTQVFFAEAFPVALGLLALFVVVGYAGKVAVAGDIGMTTAVATVLTFLYGAMAVHSDQGLLLAIVLGALTTILLAGKEEVQRFAGGIDRAERHATVKFLVVAFVVLPLLPDRELEWLLGLNPRFVWLMVVFVSGLSFLGYVLAKVVGTEHGIGLSGVLGGFVSSTATAWTMADRARRHPDLSYVCAFATVVATIAMLPRALVEVAVVNPSLLPTVVVPILVITVVALVLSSGLYWRVHTTEVDDTELTNPFRLRPALTFGALFAAILVVSEQASTLFGARGIYATAFLAGLADVDSITISLSKLAAEGDISPVVATTGIVIAAITNTAVKVGITWAIGTRRQGWSVTVVLGVAAACGLAALLVL